MSEHKTTSGMKQNFLCHQARWTLSAVYIYHQLKASDDECTHQVDISEEVAQHNKAENSSFLLLKKV